MKNLISILSILFIANSQLAFGQDFLVEEDLKLDWVFYDNNEKVMLPFLDNSRENPATIHLSVDLNHGKEEYLMIEIPANTSLFLGNKLVKHYDEDVSKHFLLDSLKSIFGSTPLQLTLFSKEGFQNPTNAKIGFIHNTFDSALRVNPIVAREKDARADYLKIIILIIISFFVVLQTLFPFDLFDFLSIRALFTFRYTSTALIKYRILTNTQAFVILYQAALIAGLMIIFLNYYYNPFGQVFFLRINPIFGWLVLIGIVLAFVFFKFVLISIISSLFGLSDRINFYFIEFLRMAMIFYSIIFVIVGYTVINHFYLVDSLLNSLIYFVIFFNVIRFIFLYFKIRRTVSLKNLHLFSYLCTTELIPIIIGLKFFLK